MRSDTPSRSLQLFPRIYYFIPCIGPHTRTVGASVLRFDEPMDAILWFVELLSQSTDAGFCPKPVLKNLIRRWYGESVDSDFERCYGELYSGGFIQSHDWTEDRRVSIVELTNEGSQLLEQIKVQRRNDMQLLRSHVLKLPRKDKKIVLRVLEDASHDAWRKMVADADSNRDYQLFRSSTTTSRVTPKKSVKRRRTNS